ncbi:hypothetical protein [Salinisphaera orenii]|uniref:Uncharacterized protein n=1 Tax=Salinisphaera orenii YIM 95161 TaxID=1051139 RepID=A0A423PDQ4_9GAMM|nr:hypothetical protein [Salinisphaera halophila]ROO23153.1 hypothetical protein SAHL_16820 [Salinisphaera halophila YIM 95161]
MLAQRSHLVGKSARLGDDAGQVVAMYGPAITCATKTATDQKAAAPDHRQGEATVTMGFASKASVGASMRVGLMNGPRQVSRVRTDISIVVPEPQESI